MRTSCSETEIKHVSLAPKFTCCRHVIKELVHAFSCAYTAISKKVALVSMMHDPCIIARSALWEQA